MTPIGHGKIRGPLLHAPHHPEKLCGALLDAAQHPEEPSTMDSLDLLKAHSGTLFRLLIGMNIIWDPFLTKDIELLESVQKIASKVCTKQWREPYNSLRSSLKLPLLKERRAVLKLSCAL